MANNMERCNVSVLYAKPQSKVSKIVQNDRQINRNEENSTGTEKVLERRQTVVLSRCRGAPTAGDKVEGGV